MVVTARTGKIHREEGTRRRRDLLVDEIEPELVRVGAFLEPLADREKGGSDEWVLPDLLRGRQQVPRELFGEETIIGFVLVEAAHDIVAIRLGQIDRGDARDLDRPLHVARHIEPMASPALTIVRRGQQPINLNSDFRLLSSDLFPRRWEAGEVEGHPSQQRVRIGHVVLPEAGLGELRLDEGIDGMSFGGWGGPDEGFQGPRFIRGEGNREEQECEKWHGHPAHASRGSWLD